MSNNIDSLFKKALQENSCEPPPHIWKNIEDKVYASKKKKKILIWWRSTAAVLLCLIALTYVLRLRVENKMSPMISDTNIAQSFPIPVSSVVPKTVLNKITPKEEKKSTPSILYTEKKKEITLPVRVSTIEQDLIKNNTSNDVYIKNNTIRRNNIPLINQHAVKSNQLYQQLLLAEMDHKEKRPEITDDKLKLSLSGHIAPGYSSGTYRSSMKNSKGAAYSKDQMNGIFNMSGGLKVAMTTGKRLSVQTGVFYTQTGQRTDESNIYVARTTLLNGNHSGKNNFSTPLGQIRGSNLVDATVYKSDGITGLSSREATTGNIKQLFGALEIPIIVKYRLNNNKVKFSVLGGISNSILVSNRTYLNYQNTRESLGKTDDIRSFNMSTDLGISVEYPISRKIKFILEPGFKYYLQSISENDAINFKPYTFSFSTGIGIDF